MRLSVYYIGKYRAMAYDPHLYIIIMDADNAFYYADTLSWGIKGII